MLSKQSKDWLLKVASTKKVFLEGNILKLMVQEKNNEDFSEYLETCIARDKEKQKRRLNVTKEVQNQNKELVKKEVQNATLMKELEASVAEAHALREAAENDKNIALEDLDIMQKRTQFELMNRIVRVALWIIAGVGILSTSLFVIVLMTDKESAIVESTWSNLLGILLTNAFSIVGTIMGVKYANGDKE